MASDPVPSAEISIPTFNDQLTLNLEAGSSTVFIGANGAGKTRLGVRMEANLAAREIQTHRIAAHRSLTLNPKVIPPSLKVAQNRLSFGRDDGSYQHKEGHRWQSKPATALLNDFDHLLAALYAENNDVSVTYRQDRLSQPRRRSAAPVAKIDQLRQIWETVLPHRRLIISAGNIMTAPADDTSAEYDASDMSDGERVIFYLIGQALLVPTLAVIIFDEPELHINKAILNRVWDEIESARPDCAFVYITHDVDFASSRRAASKFAIRAYRKNPEAWDIESVPEDSEIPDDIIARIIGSRTPVLFVEGEGGSLDSALYRRIYDNFTVISVGPCEQVIHTVLSFAARPQLHRVGCAGIIDADGRSDAERDRLERKGIYRLPVAEVENLLLLPPVFLSLARLLKFDGGEPQALLDQLRSYIFDQANLQLDEICLRYTKRKIDGAMKRIGLTSKDITQLDLEFKSATQAIDASEIFGKAKLNLSKAIARGDYEKVLLLYDNKGLLDEAAKLLGHRRKTLEEFIGRSLRSEDSVELRRALTDCLPAVRPRP